LALSANGLRCIIHGAIYEILMPLILHLDNHIFTGVRLAIHIVNGVVPAFHPADLLFVHILDADNLAFAFEQAIQEINQQHIILRGSKYQFESSIRKRINVFPHSSYRLNGYFP
jgi:hypothetical protein